MSEIQKLRVLIVDDEEAVRNALGRVLGRECDVHTCASGAEGLIYMDTDQVDLILSDCMMPGMTGPEFLLQAMQRDSRSFRVAMSGMDAHLGQMALLDGIAHRFMGKPWDLAELRAFLTAARKHLEARDRLAQTE